MTEWRGDRLNYPGDQRHAVGTTMGPTINGEYVFAERAEFDEENNRTTLFFRMATQEDFQ